MGRLSDTSPEAERVLRAVLRRLPFQQKWRQVGEMYDTARMLHAAGCRMRDPTVTAEEIARAWRAAQLGAEAPGSPDVPATDTPDVNLRVEEDSAAALDRLGVAYALGGAWVCCLFGKMRYIRGAELWAAALDGRDAALRQALGEDYAWRPRGLIHSPSGFMVDLLTFTAQPFERSALARRRGHSLPGEAGREIACLAPEDAILFELRRHRSEREDAWQAWIDLSGVLEVRMDELDHAYLDRWAANLGVAGLLRRARAEAAV
jgi:hypothetical protein